jgi:hypothetical protein
MSTGIASETAKDVVRRMLKKFKCGIDCGVRNFQPLMHQIGDWSHRFRGQAIDAARKTKILTGRDDCIRPNPILL